MDNSAERLRELRRDMERKARLESGLAELDRQKRELETKLARLERELWDERQDVKALEGFTLESLLGRITGKRDAALESERGEAAAAEAKRGAAADELAAVESEMRRVSGELQALQGCGEQYAFLLQERADEIKAAGHPAAADVTRMEERLTLLRGRMGELREALAAAEGALRLAEKVREALGDAENMGVWDIAGGGLLPDILKHSSLETAQEYLAKLRESLRGLKTELADAEIGADYDVTITGLTRTADYLFDGYFADRAALDAIDRSQYNVFTTIGRLEELIKRLKGMISSAEAERRRLGRELDELIVSAG